VAAGLDDPAYDVRLETVAFLDDNQHRGVTIRKLVRALSQYEREWDNILRDMSKTVNSQKKLQITMESKEKFLEILRKSMKSFSDMESYIEKLRKLHEVKSAVVMRLGQIPDDRSVKAVVKLLKRIVYGDQTTPYVEASLSLGTQKSVGAVVKVVVDWEKEARDRETELKRLQKVQPRKWNITREKWEEKEEKRIAMERERHEAKTAKSLRWVKSVAEKMDAFASERGLKAPPADIVPGRDWKQWFQQIKEQLPKELGDCTQEGP
jgi:hypothetical protein